MPCKRWRFACECYGENLVSWNAECDRCGEPGDYDGRHLTAYEAMAAHMKVYGLKPMGYHRPYEQQVMGPLFRRCDLCEGSGTVEIPFVVWYDCPLCDGTGVVPNVPREQITKARQQVLARYPNAAATWK